MASFNQIKVGNNLYDVDLLPTANPTVAGLTVSGTANLSAVNCTTLALREEHITHIRALGNGQNYNSGKCVIHLETSDTLKFTSYPIIEFTAVVPISQTNPFSTASSITSGEAASGYASSDKSIFCNILAQALGNDSGSDFVSEGKFPILHSSTSGKILVLNFTCNGHPIKSFAFGSSITDYNITYYTNDALSTTSTISGTFPTRTGPSEYYTYTRAIW